MPFECIKNIFSLCGLRIVSDSSAKRYTAPVDIPLYTLPHKAKCCCDHNAVKPFGKFLPSPRSHPWSGDVLFRLLRRSSGYAVYYHDAESSMFFKVHEGSAFLSFYYNNKSQNVRNRNLSMPKFSKSSQNAGVLAAISLVDRCFCENKSRRPQQFLLRTAAFIACFNLQ